MTHASVDKTSTDAARRALLSAIAELIIAVWNVFVQAARRRSCVRVWRTCGHWQLRRWYSAVASAVVNPQQRFTGIVAASSRSSERFSTTKNTRFEEPATNWHWLSTRQRRQTAPSTGVRRSTSWAKYAPSVASSYYVRTYVRLSVCLSVCHHRLACTIVCMFAVCS